MPVIIEKLNPFQRVMLEEMTYAMASKFWVGYTGGQWKYNHNCQMWEPRVKGALPLCNTMNGFEGEVQPRTLAYALAVMARQAIALKCRRRDENSAAAWWFDQMEKIKDMGTWELQGEERMALLRFLD